MKRKCTHCGTEFEADRKSRKFCSPECYQLYVKEQAEISTSKSQIEKRVIIQAKATNEKLVLLVLGDAHNNYEYLESIVIELQKHPDWRMIINGDLWDADQFSTFPTPTIESLSDSIDHVSKILQPIFPQLLGFVWGNHEERCFRRPAGKGTMPSYFDLFFERVKAINPNFQVAEPMQSMILEVKVNGNFWRTLLKHGSNAGKNLGILEFRDVMAANEDVDIIVLSHIHIPTHVIVKRSALENPKEVHWVRTTAGMAFCPYQDKKNLFVSPMGITKIYFGKDLKVDLI